MKWQASAPSNIALIKYMGKSNREQNIASNPSLSYTLEHLRTFIEIEPLESAESRWEPLSMPDQPVLELSPKAIQRFLNHVEFLKKQFDYSGAFLIRSANNFPSDCGLASSASSYAALTKAMVRALCDLTQSALPSEWQQADWSRQASGSSCRSFFGPWCLWQGERIEPLELPFPKLIHQAIVVDHERKAVSSSEAHVRVATSLLFAGRTERVQQRLQSLLSALDQSNWAQAFEVCWHEFWDMHALFETSMPAFGYITARSMNVLEYVRQIWREHQRGPMITMDAGPNVHLLYRPQDKDLAHQIERSLKPEYYILSHYELD